MLPELRCVVIRADTRFSTQDLEIDSADAECELDLQLVEMD